MSNTTDSHFDGAQAPPKDGFIDVVWMHNGWEFMIPLFQRRLDTLTTYSCKLRQATYVDGQLQVSSLAGAHVLIPAMAGITDEVLDATGSQLLLIYQPAVDSSRIDKAACAQRRIPVCNAPGSNANALAEAIVMLMLAVARKLPQGLHRCKNPPSGWGGPAGMELRGKTLGIVGVSGNSGVLLREICESGFRMRVIGVASNSSREDFNALLRQSDFVSLNCLLTEKTQHMISTNEFLLMKEGCVLINCARAGLVDRAALEVALDSGRLGGFGLDVHWEEPLQLRDPLLQRENVVGTPHLGASTQQFFDAVADLCLECLRAVLYGYPFRLRNRL